MANAERLRLMVALAAALVLSGCEHDRYADRRDSVTFGAGDSIAANKALQIIDPWPQDARTIRHGTSGEQAAAAMEKLRRRTAAASPAPPPATLTLSPAPAAAPAP
jgi:hypothetical protein